MTALKTMTLDQCCAIVSGATPKTSAKEYWDGNIFWTTPKDLSNLETHYLEDTPRKITKLGLDSCGASILPSGSVLFSSRAPIGHVAINTVPMATNQGFKSFIPKAGVLDAKFLFHWLRKNRAYLESLGNGATFKEVSKATVSRIEIEIPPIADQRRIAAILDQADALRAKRREALVQLESLTQSIFIEMFGETRTNPKLWPTQSIETVCELIVDCVNRTAPVVEDVTPYKMIRTTNVKSGKVDLRSVRYVTFETFNTWNRRATPKRGDVLLTREAPLGEAGILASDENVFLGQRMMLYRPNHEQITSEYLLHSFLSPFLQDQFNQHGSGSTVKHLPLPACRSFELRIPPLILQQAFALRIQTVESLKSMHGTALAELDALFASLQHRAFQGEL